MNARILELINNPEIIQNQDLDLLNGELKKHPYLQNIRAIHLLGTHKFESENYQKELSVTAAYTTDKKILYQFINKKTPLNPFIEQVEKEAVVPAFQEELLVPKPYNEVTIVEKPTAKPVFVEGNLNRILFEGEEDFLERENDTIDIQSTIESGKIVTENLSISKENIPDQIEEPALTETEDAENFAPETVVNEPVISVEEPAIEDLSTISFHGSEEFLPDVQIKTTNFEEKYTAPEPQWSKQELEMQRLIADVEAKMKASKKEKVSETEPIHNHDLNFSENQKLDVDSTPKEMTPVKAVETSSDLETQEEVKSDEKALMEEKTIEVAIEKEELVWKPMQFSGNTPDSLLDQKNQGKSEEKSAIVKNSTEEKIQPELKVEEEESEERPVLNVSFLTQKVSSIAPVKLENEGEEIQKTEPIIQDSNIPTFINTWQTWLKIERKEEITEENPIISKEEIKNTVIEKFIEKEPKISKLKDESDFVVKEKGSNISHLMTETLANLYVEQKLYAKAIKAYETLAEKHPHKEEIFKDKINEIKELRKNP